MKREFQRILVLKLRHIGDVLLLTPVFQALKDNFPQAELYACVNQGTEPILATNPLIAETFSVPVKGPAVGEYMHLVSVLRKKHFDLVLDFTGSDRSAILCRLTGAPERWGYFRLKGFLGRNRFFTRTGRRKPGAHVVEQQSDLLNQFSIPSAAPHLAYHVRPADRVTVSKYLETEQPLAHIHPVSRLMVKTWPAPFMAKLVDYLSSRGLLPVLTASPDPAELKWIGEVKALAREPLLDLSGKLSLLELAALSERSALFVGVDSAPLHLAAAVGTPVIGIFGPSSEILWGPWSDKKLVLSREMDCRLPCKLKDACPHIACLREMTADMVLPKVDAFLKNVLKL